MVASEISNDGSIQLDFNKMIFPSWKDRHYQN
uniref:Uncharacterized protein n=1 Tax=Arundo donax TaxID=35708 RepID=A0A0A9G3V5_ARUDO